MKFSVSLDLKAKMVTWFTAVVFGVIGYLFVRSSDYSTGFWSSMSANLVVTLILLGVLISAYGLSPKAYVLEADRIIVRRRILRDVTIQLSDVRNISGVNKDVMNRNVDRAFASGGLFGYFGEFTGGGLGLMTWYATRTSNYVLIETNVRHKIVLTPDDTGFISEVRIRLEKILR